MFSQQKKPTQASGREEEERAEQRRLRERREKCGGPSIFIAKTYEILQNDFFGEVVSWNSEGTHFVIHDIDRFQQEVLPQYFRHRKFSSFVRQLNMYDFHKIRNETNKNIFEHKEFRRDSGHSLRNIRRKGCGSQRRTEALPLPDCPDEAFESELEFNFDRFEKQKGAQNRATFQSIQNYSIAALAEPTPSSPAKEDKELAMNEFVAALPPGMRSENEVKTIVDQLKKRGLTWLTAKKDVQELVRKITRTKMVRLDEDGIDDLSIEEEIMAQNICSRELSEPQLQLFHSEIWHNGSSTNNYLSPAGAMEEWFFHTQI